MAQQMQMAMMQMQMQMQMGAMIQMQMAQMQMMPMMPVPVMLPLQPAPPGDPDAAELAQCSFEDLAALELEAQEAEEVAKGEARRSDGFVGLMARYIEDEGFGFISCPECKELWTKTDIFISGRNFMAAGVDVGDMVSFSVEKDGKDLPRACKVRTLPELTGLRKRLAKLREILRVPAPAAGLKRIGSPEPGRPAKRANLGS